METTKKCTECMADIPVKARKCSHCGSKQKTSYTLKQWLIGIIAVFAIVITIGIVGSSPTTTPTRQVSESDGYKLALIDSNDAQYARANESHYSRLISNIEQNCILDSGQKISDMLVVTQRLIREDAGQEFKLSAIAIRADEILSRNQERVRCDEFMASFATIATSNL